MSKLDLSIIIPVYNEEEVLPLLFERLNSVVTSLTRHNISLEIVFINDGSKDNSFSLLKQYANNSQHPVTIINFTRNFGHQAALTAGYANAQGKYHVTIDADLQDPPELIPRMLKLAKRHKVHVVYGKRISRKENSAFKTITAKLYYKILNRLAYIHIPEEVADFRLVSEEVTQNLLKMRSLPRFLRGDVAYLGYPYKLLKYHRDARAKGQTKYTLRKMLTLAATGLINYSYKIPTLVSSYLLALTLTFVFLGALGLSFNVLFFSFITFGLIPTISVLLLYTTHISQLLHNKPEYVIAEIIKNNSYEDKH